MSRRQGKWRRIASRIVMKYSMGSSFLIFNIFKSVEFEERIWKSYRKKSTLLLNHLLLYERKKLSALEKYDTEIGHAIAPERINRSEMIQISIIFFSFTADAKHDLLRDFAITFFFLVGVQNFPKIIISIYAK